MTSCPVRMRLLHSDADDSYLLLYADGTMSGFSANEPDSQALTDILTRYQGANILTADGKNVGRWKEKGTNVRMDEVTSFNGKDYETAAQAVLCDEEDETMGFRLEIVSPEIVGLWLDENATADADSVNTPIQENNEYLSLEEYCAEINAGRPAEEAISLNAVRTRIARNGIPGAVKIGARWAVPSGTPWPQDRRYKISK